MTTNAWKRIIVIDFEATCDEPQNPVPQEIIEFPAVVVDLTSQTVVREFHRYVRPVVHPRLTEFCVELTGIQQATIDNADDFPTVFSDFEHWIGANELSDAAVATCGNWDLNYLLPAQCHQHTVHTPTWARSWINVKEAFARTFPGAKVRGLAGMLGHLGLTFEGRPHSGIDDARNIARVLLALLTQNADCLMSAAPPVAADHDASVGDRIAKLFERLTPDCGKAQAQDIEFAILDLAKQDANAILPFASLQAPYHRECVAFVSGKLIQKGLATEQILALLQGLTRDTNEWVRKKAIRALSGGR